VLLHDTPVPVAAAAFERLRTAVGKHPFPEGVQVTISTGWTRLRPQDTSREAIDRADRALYYAKKAGRDRACMYESLEASGEFASGDGTGRYAHLDRR
jgi:PleD family two-component response regulator